MRSVMLCTGDGELHVIFLIYKKSKMIYSEAISIANEHLEVLWNAKSTLDDLTSYRMTAFSQPVYTRGVLDYFHISQWDISGTTLK